MRSGGGLKNLLKPEFARRLVTVNSTILNLETQVKRTALQR